MGNPAESTQDMQKFRDDSTDLISGQENQFRTYPPKQQLSLKKIKNRRFTALKSLPHLFTLEAAKVKIPCMYQLYHDSYGKDVFTNEMGLVDRIYYNIENKEYRDEIERIKAMDEIVEFDSESDDELIEGDYINIKIPQNELPIVREGESKSISLESNDEVEQEVKSQMNEIIFESKDEMKLQLNLDTFDSMLEIKEDIKVHADDSTLETKDEMEHELIQILKERFLDGLDVYLFKYRLKSITNRLITILNMMI